MHFTVSLSFPLKEKKEIKFNTAEQFYSKQQFSIQIEERGTEGSEQKEADRNIVFSLVRETEHGPESPPSGGSVRNSSNLTQRASYRTSHNLPRRVANRDFHKKMVIVHGLA